MYQFERQKAINKKENKLRCRFKANINYVMLLAYAHCVYYYTPSGSLFILIDVFFLCE